jgi:magnesium-transporting ATPase (P-type)
MADTFFQKSFVPFDFENRRTAVLVERGTEELKVIKGAVRTNAKKCGFKE